MEVNGNKIAFMGCNGKRAEKYPKAGEKSQDRHYVIMTFLGSRSTR